MPDAVREVTGGNRRDQLGLRSATIDLHFVQAADGYIGEFAVGIVREGDVIGDRAGIERREDTEWRRAADDLNFARVLEREPYFLTVVADCQVRREGAGLRQTRDNPIAGCIDDIEFGREARR